MSLCVALNRSISPLTVCAPCPELGTDQVHRPTVPSSHCWTLGVIAIPTYSFEFQMPRMPQRQLPRSQSLHGELCSDPQTRRIVIGFDRALRAADESRMRLHTLIRDYQSQRLDPSHRRYGPSHGASVYSQQGFGIICVWFWGLRPRVGKGFHAGPISRKSALLCPLRN